MQVDVWRDVAAGSKRGPGAGLCSAHVEVDGKPWADRFPNLVQEDASRRSRREGSQRPRLGLRERAGGVPEQEQRQNVILGVCRIALETECGAEAVPPIVARIFTPPTRVVARTSTLGSRLVRPLKTA